MITYKHSGRMLLAVSALSLGLATTSCRDNDDKYSTPYFTLNQGKDTDITFPKDGGQQSLHISTNRKWTATTSASWLSVSPSSGEDNTTTLVVKALANSGVARTATITVTAGAHTFTYTVSQTAGANPQAEATYEGTPLADFIASLGTIDSNGKVIDQDISVQAVVISDRDGGNSVSLKNIVLQANGAGIMVRLQSNSKFNTGELLTLKLKGTKILRYNNGGLQLDFSTVGDAGITSTREIRQIEPTVATLAELYAGKYENMLVRVDGVQFKETTGVLNSLSKGTKYHTITDCSTLPADANTTNEIGVGITNYAQFKGEVVSDKRGSITGIIQHSKSQAGQNNITLFPRTAADINLTEERCTDGSVAPTQPSDQPSTSAATTLQSILANYSEGSIKTYDEELSFEATVIEDLSNEENRSNNHNLTLQSGTQGLIVRMPKVFTYPKGTVLRVNVKGASLGRYNNGPLQLDFSKVPDAESKVVNTGKTQVISPIKVSLADIYAGKYENVLVEVEGVQFTTTNGKLGGTDTKTKFNRLEDCTTTTPDALSGGVSVAISGYSKVLKGTDIPQGYGSVIGVLAKFSTQSNKGYNLYPRTVSDLSLSASRCSSNTPSTPGTIPSTPAIQPTNGTTNSLMITAYVEGDGYEKYIQIYNPTDHAIDLSEYMLVLEPYNASNKSATESSVALSGSLAPKQVKVYKNSKAEAYAEGEGLSNINFNGNDNVAIKKGETIVDVIGTWGNAWTNGKDPVGADQIIRRNTTVTKPSTSYDASQWTSTPFTLKKNDEASWKKQLEFLNAR